MVILEDFYKKKQFTQKKSVDDTKSMKNDPLCKE